MTRNLFEGAKLIVTRSCIGGLFNFDISKLKTYQFTIVLITIGWTWELVLGNMSSIGNWLQLRYCQVKKKLRVQSIWFANWKFTDWQTDWPANWQTKRLTDWLSYWLMDLLRETDWLTGYMNEKLTDWLTDWLADWLTDRMIAWLTDKLKDMHWLASWLTE